MCLSGTFTRRDGIAETHNYEGGSLSIVLEDTTMDMQHLSDRELLAAIVGPHAANKLYHGALAPLFEDTAPLTSHHEKLLAAKELVTRLLYENLVRDVLFS